MIIDFNLVWAGIIAMIIIIYVVLDGFDLGIGILFPFVRDTNERHILMNSIAPVWDGNETWLVFGGAALYGAFPIAYGVLLPTLYLPIILMLVALILRGVSFEFRFKAQRSRIVWDIAFFSGSIAAAFLQGAILGTFVGGFELNHTDLIITDHRWLTPFSLMTGLAVVCGYALLGATWMIIKSEGLLQQTMYRYARYLLIGVAVFMAAVSLWTPFQDPSIFNRWFSLPNFFYLAPLPLITVIAMMITWFSLVHKTSEHKPFIMSIGLFILGYIGLVISVWPYFIPHELTLWEVAAPANTQKFILVGTVIILPLLLGYTWYAYHVFRGKVKADAGYH
ncbi:MAG: cytochrome d ubiquinol oxidase subunit II [Legionellales bacterium]|nr:cytochrome d ubiquinol oxidase subunit II [Legionellales bacterium]